jgi:HlyD family secretion protein
MPMLVSSPATSRQRERDDAVTNREPRGEDRARGGPRVGVRAAAALLGGFALLASCGGETLELVGTVERQNLELAAPLSEEIVEIPVKVGQRVAAGDVLVRLDTRIGELELKAAQARVAAAQANLDAAQGEFERVQGLARARVSSQKDLDLARRAHGEAVAQLAEREAEAAQAEKRREDLTVRASAAGVVDQLPFEVGERVPAGGVAAVVLADAAPWVRLWVPARAVVRVVPGAPAEVEIEGIAGRLTGRVESVSREAQFTPHYALTEKERANLVFEARVVITDAPAQLRPGVPASVRLPLRPELRPGGP